MNSKKCLQHNNTFMYEGVEFKFKEGLNCPDCCFCQEDPDGFFLCEVPSLVPYCQNGGFVVSAPDKSRHHVELTDDQVSTVLYALEAFRHSVTDSDLYERITSCLTVFENI